MAQEKTTTQTVADESQGALANFSWDGGNSDSFFGIGGEAGEVASEDDTDVAQVMKEIGVDDEDEELEEVFKNQTGKPKAPTKKEAATAKAKQEPDGDDDEPTEPEFNFGGEGDDDEEEVNEDEPAKDKSKDAPAKPPKEKVKPGAEKQDSSFTDLVLDLKDRGILQHAEVNEGDEVDADGLYEHIDKEVESRVDETFEAFFEEMPEEGKALLKHLKAGGSTADFVSVFGNKSLNIQNFDAEDKKHREQVIAHYLRLTDGELDQDDINDRIEYLEENGKAKKMAEKYFDRIKAQEEQDKAELLQAQQDADKAKADSIKAFTKSLTNILEKTEEVKGFKFSGEDKKRLNKLILNPTIKVGKNKYIPEFNFKLGEILKAQTPEATQKLFLLAKLIDNDFDITDVKVKAKTEATREVKSRIAAAKKNVKPSSAGNFNNGKKALADFID